MGILPTGEGVSCSQEETHLTVGQGLKHSKSFGGTRRTSASTLNNCNRCQRI